MAVTLVATADEVIVGYILGLTQHGRLKHIVRLYSLAVTPKMQKKRIGQQLMKRFIAQLKKPPVNTIMLEVAKRNKPAIKLFTKMGFQQKSVMPDYYGPGYTGLRMQLMIAED